MSAGHDDIAIGTDDKDVTTSSPGSGAPVEGGARLLTADRPSTATEDIALQGERGEGAEEKQNVRTGEALAEPLHKSARGRLAEGDNAREAAKRSAASRAAKKLARESAAELDKLTLGSRAGTMLARKLSAEDIGQVVVALAEGAKAGKVMHARELRAWLVMGLGLTEQDADEGTPWHLMTQAQRDAHRATLLRAAEMAEEDARAAASEHAQ